MIRYVLLLLCTSLYALEEGRVPVQKLPPLPEESLLFIKAENVSSDVKIFDEKAQQKEGVDWQDYMYLHGMTPCFSSSYGKPTKETSKLVVQRTPSQMTLRASEEKDSLAVKNAYCKRIFGASYQEVSKVRDAMRALLIKLDR